MVIIIKNNIIFKINNRKYDRSNDRFNKLQNIF